MIQLFRASPGLLIWAGILGVAIVVCGILGVLMVRNGLSTRPVLWFAGLLLLIGGPQFVAHLASARATLYTEKPRIQALNALAAERPRNQRSAAAKMLLGADADPDLISDARIVFGGVLEKAEIARFASLPNGETVLLARFPGYLDAEQAWSGYLRYTGLSEAGGKGDSQRGYVATRSTGDRAYALHLRNMLAVWTGPDDGTIRQRMAAGGFKVPSRAPLGKTPGEPFRQTSSENTLQASPGPTRRDIEPRNFFGLALPAGGLAVYVLLVGVYFIKGASWAGTSSPLPGKAPSSASELYARLESLNSVDLPFKIEPTGGQPNELLATWRYGDSRWFGPGRAHGASRVHQIKLTLDESSHTVRATDYSAEYKWSAGGSGADIQWKAGLGITFFHYDRRRSYGVSVDSQGRPKPETSYTYTFDLREMKSPLIEMVTRAGWRWRPVVWQAPKGLGWIMN